jgi:hypothetical protein
MDKSDNPEEKAKCTQERSQLTPWLQNQKVHYRIHNSPTPVPILNQLDLLYTPPANLLKIHSDPILPSMPWSSKWSLSFWLSRQRMNDSTEPCPLKCE